MIKVYSLRRMRAAVLTVTDGVSTIRATFQPSYGTQGKTNGKIVVIDENLQRIFEADPKFNVTYYLSDEYPDTAAPKMETTRTGERFIAPPTAHKVRRTQAQIDAENAAKEEEAARKSARNRKTAESSANKAPSSTTVSSKNEAIEILAEKGETASNEEELVELMQKHNIVIKA